MDDDGGDWFGGGDDEPPPTIKPLKKPGQEAEPAPAAGEGEAPAEGGQGDAPQEGELPPEDEDYLDPDRLLLFKHWIRPKFLPYKYISLYRKIYYDDVIDYMNKKSRGIPRELPHAETWAERLVRNCRDKVAYQKVFKRIQRNDLELVEKTRHSGNLFYYHSKNVFNKQFSPLLY